MSDLVGNPEDRFSRVAAQLMPVMYLVRLILRNLKVDDSGHYECEARNAYGIVRSNAFLVVKRGKYYSVRLQFQREG